MTKYFTLIFFTAVSYLIFLQTDFSYSQTYWLRQQTPTENRITNCFFINNSTGWAAGDSGLIMKSTDSGVSWIKQNTNTTHDINSIFFLNERFGWANAFIFDPGPDEYQGTLLLKTSDGGMNWNSSIYPDTSAYYGSVYFLDSLNGFLGGTPKFIVNTTNNGSSWSDAISDSINTNGYPVKNIFFLNNDTGFACGGLQDLAGIVWKTINKGRNWKPVVIGPDPVNNMYFFSNDTSIALSGDFKFGANIFRTTDNWHSSININLNYVGMAQSIDFRNRNDGWVSIGYLSKFFRTTDAGYSWTILDIPDTSAVFDIQFTDSLHGWCVGDHGAVYKYNALMTGVSSLHTNTSADYLLPMNYPNPFNPVTKIIFEVPESVNFRNNSLQTQLTVYDILGNDIKTLVNEKRSPGRYEVTFDGTGLSSGIYFYILSIEGKNVPGRSMLLLK